MDLKEVKKIIIRCANDSCIVDFVENYKQQEVGIVFEGCAVYKNGRRELIKVSHYYNDNVLKLIEENKQEELESILSDTYDCFTNFEECIINDTLEGKFGNDDNIIIDGVKIPCEFVSPEFNIREFLKENN